jgi:hypothetical protein
MWFGEIKLSGCLCNDPGDAEYEWLRNNAQECACGGHHFLKDDADGCPGWKEIVVSQLSLGMQ